MRFFKRRDGGLTGVVTHLLADGSTAVIQLPQNLTPDQMTELLARFSNAPLSTIEEEE